MLAAFVLVVFVSVGLYANPGHASAASGYFTGRPTKGFENNILSGGVHANDAGSFVGVLYNYLNFGNYQDQIGAAYVIDHMLGQGSWAGRGGASAGVNYARINFGVWQNLVNAYANSSNAAYGVQWSVWRTGVNPNSAYFSSISDDALHPYESGVDDGAVIRFYWPGGEFLIQIICGNLAGNLQAPPLPPVNHPPYGSVSVTCDPATSHQVATVTLGDADGGTVGYISTGGWNSGQVGSPGPVRIDVPQSVASPYVAQTVYLYVEDVGPGGSRTWQLVAAANTNVPCATLSCGSLNVNPLYVDPYMKFAATVNVNNNVNATPPGATISISITPPAGATYSFNGSQPAGGGGGISSATFANLGPTSKAGVYKVNWTLRSPSISKSCSATLPVVYLPYLNVYGGDVMTGASASYNGGSGASSCGSPNNAAGIYGWNNYSTNFSGAGTQYGAQALAQILGFASAQNSSSAVGTSLSFANQFNPPDASKLNPGANLFGGYFGGTTADCDFTSDLTGAPATSDTVISTTTVAAGARDVRYIKGADVFITGTGIRYANTGGWSSPIQIPYFKMVVVGGNIYIDSSVSQLDGLYVAEPSGASGGNIYTCASGLRSPVSPTKFSGTSFYATCNRQLVINGAFVAKQVQFGRTAGSLGQATTTDTASSNHAAEVFNYTPELWLPRGGSNPNGGYTAITGLPPTL